MHAMIDAVRDPESFIDSLPHPSFKDLAILASTAAVGIGVYGGAIHAAEGATHMALGAGRGVLAAGLAWSLSLPSLVIWGRAPLPWRQGVLASLVGVHFGGLAFAASVPVVALFEVATGSLLGRQLFNVLVVMGVGGCTSLVLLRTLSRIEHGVRWSHLAWLTTFSILFLELAWLIDWFSFGGVA